MTPLPLSLSPRSFLLSPLALPSTPPSLAGLSPKYRDGVELCDAPLKNRRPTTRHTSRYHESKPTDTGLTHPAAAALASAVAVRTVPGLSGLLGCLLSKPSE